MNGVGCLYLHAEYVGGSWKCEWVRVGGVFLAMLLVVFDSALAVGTRVRHAGLCSNMCVISSKCSAIVRGSGARRAVLLSICRRRGSFKRGVCRMIYKGSHSGGVMGKNLGTTVSTTLGSAKTK